MANLHKAIIIMALLCCTLVYAEVNSISQKGWYNQDGILIKINDFWYKGTNQNIIIVSENLKNLSLTITNENLQILFNSKLSDFNNIKDTYSINYEIPTNIDNGNYLMQIYANDKTITKTIEIKDKSFFYKLRETYGIIIDAIKMKMNT